MASKLLPRLCLGLLLCGAALAGAAHAAEIKVLTAGAYKPVLLELTPGFERSSGHTLKIDNDTAGGLQKRIAGGEAFDLVVLTPAALEPLQRAGKFAAPGPRPLARVGVGVAVKQGAPLPDISSVAALKQALLKARGVATVDPASGGTSGIYLWKLFAEWGIADQLRPQAQLVAGGHSAERVVSGQAEIALQQASELLAVPGVVLVGPLPAEIQVYTTYSAALSAQAREGTAAQALLTFLAGPDAAPVLRAKGMLPP